MLTQLTSQRGAQAVSPPGGEGPSPGERQGFRSWPRAAKKLMPWGKGHGLEFQISRGFRRVVLGRLVPGQHMYPQQQPADLGQPRLLPCPLESVRAPKREPCLGVASFLDVDGA